VAPSQPVPPVANGAGSIQVLFISVEDSMRGR
jgi:hypothetical protein